MTHRHRNIDYLSTNENFPLPEIKINTCKIIGCFPRRSANFLPAKGYVDGVIFEISIRIILHKKTRLTFGENCVDLPELSHFHGNCKTEAGECLAKPFSGNFYFSDFLTEKQQTSIVILSVTNLNTTIHYELAIIKI